MHETSAFRFKKITFIEIQLSKLEVCSIDVTLIKLSFIRHGPIIPQPKGWAIKQRLISTRTRHHSSHSGCTSLLFQRSQCIW